MLKPEVQAAVTKWESVHKYGQSYSTGKFEKSLLREWQEERQTTDYALAFGLGILLFVLMTGAH